MQYNLFGQFIKAKREQLGIKQGTFAINSDIEPAILCRIENLKQDTKLNVLVKIANGFGLSASELLKEYEKEYEHI